MYDEFNPDSTVRELPSLIIVPKTGPEIPITTRYLNLIEGDAITLSVDEQTEEISFGVNAKGSLYHTQKFETLRDMIEGGSVAGPYMDPETLVTPDGTAWLFTDLSLYISSLNKNKPEPESGVVFAVTEDCANVIQNTNGFTLIDVCAPCIDCPTYATLQSYLTRIDDMLEYIWQLTGDKDTATIPVPPTDVLAENFTGVYMQSLAALNYWNYLVHKQSVKASAQAFGQSVSASAYYRNISPSTVVGIEITITFRFMLRESGGGLVNWDGVTGANTEVRVINREGVDNAVLLAGPTYGANYVTVVLDAGSLTSGQEIYGDVVLMLLNTNLFDTIVDQVLIVVDFTFNVTHIGASILLSDTVYFRAVDNPSAGS
jgi:hypothetical protein